MRGRSVVLAAVALATLGAGDVAGAATVDDVCGDVAYLAAGGDRTVLQPGEWDRNDLAGLTVAEIRGSADEVVGLDVVVEVCGDAATPSRPGEFLEVRWDVSDGCWASVALGHGGNSAYVTSNTGLMIGPDDARFSLRCLRGHAYDMVGTVEDRAVVALGPDRVTVEGRTVLLSLRAVELGELAGLVSDGASIPGARATSNAAVGTGVAFDVPGIVGGGLGAVDWSDPTPVLTLGD